MKNFDIDWHSSKLRVLLVAIIPILLFFVSLLFTFRNMHTPQADVILPPEKDGFVGKANVLLMHLLCDSDYIDHNVAEIKDIESLNKKYKALIFAMPYGDDVLAMREDIRLVGIRPEMIKDDKERDFFYNSSLPLLLEKQLRDLGEKYFKISTKRTKKGTEIEKIGIIRSMFKVALTKDPWSGSVIAPESPLFEQDSCLFLSYGNMVLPLKLFNRIPPDNQYVQLNIDTDAQKMSLLNEDRGLDYYKYYQKAFRGNRFTKLVISNSHLTHESAEFSVKCVKDEANSPHLLIKLNRGILCTIYSNGKPSTIIQSSNHEAAPNRDISFYDGMKIVLEAVGNREKIAEFTVTKYNPSLILSSLVRTNSGTRRFFASEHTDVFTQQVLRGLSANLSNTKYPKDVFLSVDPLLSKEFEMELQSYLQTLKRSIRVQSGQRWDISLTIMDMATGNVIATPFVTDFNNNVSDKITLTRKNPALERRYIGSVFKPMLTLASVHQNPSLLNLNTQGKLSCIESDDKGCSKGMFLGATTKGWAPVSHWSGCDMKNFLSHSDDVYPVALAALCLNGYNDNTDLNTIHNINSNMGDENKSLFDKSPNNIIIGNRSPSGFELFQLLDALYNINSYDVYDADSAMMTNYMWRNLCIENGDYFGLSEVSPEVTIMQYDNMVGHNRTLRGELTPWVLGQGNNYWNCIKLGEAWCRMLSKKAVSASFVIDKDDSSADSSLVDNILTIKNNYNSHWDKGKINKTWNQFLDVFKDAQTINSSNSTLYKMYNNVSDLNTKLGLNTEGRRLVLFSKTGTPSEYFHRLPSIDGSKSYIDLGIYCMGLMTEASLTHIKANNNSAKGIVCIIRVTRQYPQSTKDSGLWSTNARDFFTQERLEKLYYMTRSYF